MKLLFDQNMSPKLPERLCDVFADSVHIQHHHLERAPDNVLWDFAKEHGFAIVTKDIDFSERSMLFGFPPKVIWFKRGNCSTTDMEHILRRHATEIRCFLGDDDTGIFVIQ